MQPPLPLPLHNLGPFQSPLALGDTVGEATVLQVATGVSHGVAMLSDGSVRCWGDQSSGKCRVPDPLEEVVAVAASDRHTMALQADGRVRAWGAMSLAKSALPRRAGKAVEIRAGATDRGCWSAARLDNGRVRIWGRGVCTGSPWPVAEEHRLDFAEWSVPHLKQGVAIERRRAENRGQCDVSTDLGPAIAVSAGLQHTAALLEDGQTRGWGREVPADR